MVLAHREKTERGDTMIYTSWDFDRTLCKFIDILFWDYPR